MRKGWWWMGLILWWAAWGYAQPQIEVNWRLRVEDWQWFNVENFDTDYTYAHSLLRAAVKQQNGSTRWLAELAQVGLFSVPNAVAPPPAGQLGFGGTLRAVNDDNRASLFVKQLQFTWEPSWGQLTVGRMEFGDGREVVAKDPSLNWVQANRIANRMIGTFGFSPVTRSFDGVLVQKGEEQARWVFFAAYPTQGAFHLNANPTLTSVNQLYLAYAQSADQPLTASNWRLFAGWYRDARNVVKVDNRPEAARQADQEEIGIWTVGGHWAQVWRSLAGRTDALVWGAVQGGDWGRQRHSAYAIALEAGFQFPTLWKPWVRAGYYVGSGDDDPADNTHATFIAGMHTPRLYALTPFYNTTNIEDSFVQLLLTPHPRWSVRLDYHYLRLHRANDLWYAGGGPFENATYGINGRPSGRHRQLAHLFDISVNYRASERLQLSLYKSWIQGGSVIRSVYPAGEDGGFFFVEANYRF